MFSHNSLSIPDFPGEKGMWVALYGSSVFKMVSWSYRQNFFKLFDPYWRTDGWVKGNSVSPVINFVETGYKKFSLNFSDGGNPVNNKNCQPPSVFILNLQIIIEIICQINLSIVSHVSLVALKTYWCELAANMTYNNIYTHINLHGHSIFKPINIFDLIKFHYIGFYWFLQMSKYSYRLIIYGWLNSDKLYMSIWQTLLCNRNTQAGKCISNSIGSYIWDCC